jgi:hypothetical protein
VVGVIFTLKILVFVIFSKEEGLRYFFWVLHIFMIIFQNSRIILVCVICTVSKCVVIFVFYMPKVNIKLWVMCIIRVFLVSAEFVSWFIYAKLYILKLREKEAKNSQINMLMLMKIIFCSIKSITNRNYRISWPIRRTFFPEKCNLNSTCVLGAEGKYYFETYKYPYSYYTTPLSWDSEICFQIMSSGITACERRTFL